MTSGSLYFKLLKEDMKRRTWAIALVFLTFFFSLPIKLAMAMENAANTDYYVFNDYQKLIQDGSIPDALFQEKLLALKTKVVMSQAAFGNGIVVFFLIVLAVVIGVSSFAYLHNRRKIDLYHSIPVRREVLYGAQFTGGILIVALSYLINLVLMMCVVMSYGVPMGNIAGAMAGGWALNMLYFMLMYAVVVVAMMMTGNLVVGVLASGILFFFMPVIMMILSGYCQTFFVTTARNMWTSASSPFMWGIKYLSPFSIYMTAIDWGTKRIGQHVPEVICTVFGFLAIALLGMQLYRKRPSEAAGRAMAFKRTMAPIRIIMVLGSGLAGGMFFWMLQSKMKWGLFGVIVSVILAHCIIEIIYHFDFKKLFGSRIQLGICLAAGVLLFLSFRYDWYGFDSYLPAETRISSASLEIGMDSHWLNRQAVEPGEDGKLDITYYEAYEDIEKSMVLTDLDLVMPMVKTGREQMLAGRDERIEGSGTAAVTVTQDSMAAANVSIIGGADGPTSVFVAGKLGGEPDKQEYLTNVTVCYNLANGRQVRRSYDLYLSDVIDIYEKLYNTKEYKEGLYTILSQTPEQFSEVYYREAGDNIYTGKDSAELSELLSAYQTDLMALNTRDRIQDAPIGTLCFVTKDSQQYLTQLISGAQPRRYRYDPYGTQELNQSWPVYPSFTNTLQILNKQGVKPGEYFNAEHVKEIVINVHSMFYNENTYGDLPEGDELEALRKVNPYYVEDGYLRITDRNEINRLMDALTEEEFYYMAAFQPSFSSTYCEVKMDNNETISAQLLLSHMTPEIQNLFTGLPVNQTNN